MYDISYILNLPSKQFQMIYIAWFLLNSYRPMTGFVVWNISYPRTYVWDTDSGLYVCEGVKGMVEKIVLSASGLSP